MENYLSKYKPTLPDLEELSKEELLGLLDHPEEIDCAGNPWENEEEQEYTIKQIKNILVDKFGMKRKVL